MWKIFGGWTRKSAEHHKHKLVDHPSGITEDGVFKSFVGFRSSSQKVSEGDNINK